MIVIAILGLLLPGYALALALNSRIPWAVAFPLSALLIAETVILCAMLAVPIRFGYVLGVLIVVSLLCSAVWFRGSRQTTVASAKPPRDSGVKLLLVVVTVTICIILVGLAVRTTLYPLSGYDTLFRWEALARLMLEQQSLSYYPPVTAENFSKYTYPDGVPPLTSAIYWWLYAAWGEPCPALSSVPILLQLVSCLALVFHASNTLFGRAGGLMSLGALATSTLFLRGVGIGQESGYTALSFAGQLAFAFATVREPRASSVVLAGLFAVLGALSREYGPLLATCGLVVLISHRETRRYLPLYCLVVAVGGGAWYVRNWYITGNPVYALDVGLGFAVNPIHIGILKNVHEIYGVRNYSFADWVTVSKQLLLGAPLVLLPGMLGLALAGKRGILLAICALLSLALWFSAISYTSGGIGASLRVLTTFWVALAIAVGVFGQLWQPAVSPWKRYLRGAIVLLIALCGGYAAALAWAFPAGPSQIRQAIWLKREGPMAEDQAVLAQGLEKLKLPATGVLTDNCYLAVALQRYTRFRPVMIWSPEVSFVFDAQLDPGEIRRRLVNQGIELVAVWSTSPNIKFMLQFPFYRDDLKNWEKLLSFNQSEVIYYLPRQKSADPAVVPLP